MHTIVISPLRILALVFCFATHLSLAGELSREVAMKIIADAEQVRANEVTIGPMHEVDRTLANGTVARDGVCVTFICPKVVDGTTRRVISFRTFYHDAEWGWYLYATKTVRGGEVIDVVSETKGSFQLK
ncbi:MAG: hypothetical protein ACN4GG_06705 [Akkermansiaceae bacterium]